MSEIVVSVILIHYKNKRTLFSCLNSLYKSKTNFKYEVIVVDNDEVKTVERKLLTKYKKLIYVPSQWNLGYSAGINLGFTYALGDRVFVLNTDILLERNCLSVLNDFLDKNKKVAIVSPKLLNENNRQYTQTGSANLGPIQGIFSLSFLNRLFPMSVVLRKYWLKDENFASPVSLGVVPGAAMLIRSAVYKKVGGFDPNFFLYFEESDLCKRVREAGWKIFIIPQAKVVHLWGASTPKSPKIKKIFAQSRFYYFKKHYGIFWALVVEAFARFSKKHAIALTATSVFIVIILIL